MAVKEDGTEVTQQDWEAMVFQRELAVMAARLNHDTVVAQQRVYNQHIHSLLTELKRRGWKPEKQ